VRPGNTPHIETVLAPGELIRSVLLPPPTPGSAGLPQSARPCVLRVRALCRFAVVVALDGDPRARPRASRFGGISYKPWRSREADAELIGTRGGRRASFDAAGVAALRDAGGYGHNDFKIPLAPPHPARRAGRRGRPHLRRTDNDRKQSCRPDRAAPLDRVDGRLKVTGGGDICL